MSRAYDNAADARFQQGGRRNLIINGAMEVAQRGTSVSGSTATGYYTVDRWRLGASGATYNASQQSFTLGQTDVPSSFKNFHRMEVTTGDNNAGFDQRIEDVITVSGEPVTLSFYAKGTNPAGGSMEISCQQNFGTGGSSSVSTTVGTYSLTSSWQRFTFTFTVPSISGKTVGTGSNIQINNRQPNADTSTDAWTLDITGVQLELGNVATPFEHRSYGEELALCQRYYWKYEPNYFVMGRYSAGSGTPYGELFYPVQMRANPSLTQSGMDSGSGFSGALSLEAVTINAASLRATTSQSANAIVYARSGVIELDAEL